MEYAQVTQAGAIAVSLGLSANVPDQFVLPIRLKINKVAMVEAVNFLIPAPPADSQFFAAVMASHDEIEDQGSMNANFLSIFNDPRKIASYQATNVGGVIESTSQSYIRLPKPYPVVNDMACVVLASGDFAARIAVEAWYHVKEISHNEWLKIAKRQVNAPRTAFPSLSTQFP